jgi:hypothetical protein
MTFSAAIAAFFFMGTLYLKRKRYKSHADRFDAEPLSTKFIPRFGQLEISLSTPHSFTPSPTH